MDIKETQNIMNLIGEDFDWFKTGERRVRMWQRLLEHITFKEAAEALKALLLQQRKHAPRAADINDMVIANRRVKAAREKEQEKEKEMVVIESEETKRKNIAILQKLRYDLSQRKHAKADKPKT